MSLARQLARSASLFEMIDVRRAFANAFKESEDIVDVDIKNGAFSAPIPPLTNMPQSTFEVKS